MGVLDAEIPPDGALARVDDEKLRNIANIESALDIFGCLKYKGISHNYFILRLKYF